jgi:hypothetical protein
MILIGESFVETSEEHATECEPKCDCLPKKWLTAFTQIVNESKMN